jgi:hypothetical protein
MHSSKAMVSLVYSAGLFSFKLVRLVIQKNTAPFSSGSQHSLVGLDG